jgi:predicted nuclease with TOPRIM domain
MISEERQYAAILKDIAQLKSVANKQQQRIAKLEHDNSQLKEKFRVQSGEITFLKRKL